MKHLSILWRVALVALPPLAGLLFLAAQELRLENAQADSYGEMEQAAAILRPIADFMHALQAERGMSASYRASGDDPAMRQRLTERQTATDRAAAALQAEVAEREKAYARLRAMPAVSTALEAAGSAPKLRRVVADGGKVPEILAAYTGAVDRLLTSVRLLHGESRDDALAAAILAMNTQLRLSELSGLERAVGAAGIASGGFAPEAFVRYAGLAMQQKAMTDVVGAWASPEVKDALDAALAAPESREVESLRAALLTGGGAIPEGFPAAARWFELASARIGKLIEAERFTLSRIAALAAAGRSETLARLRVGLGVTLAGLGVILAVAAIAARMVAAPLKTLATQAEQLAWGQVVDISYADRRDEVGTLARAVNEINRVVRISKRNASALKCSSSALMIADRNRNIVFVNGRLEESLLESKTYWQSVNPGVDFSKLTGLSIDLFHKDPARIGAMLDRLDKMHDAEIDFDDRQFKLMVVPIIEGDERLGYVVEWAETTAARLMQAQIADVIARVRQGDFSGRIQIDSAEAFLIAIRDGMNDIGVTMGAFMADMQAALSAGADGDLTLRMREDRGGDLGRLATDANGMFDRLGALMEDVKRRTGALGEVSSTVLDTSRDLSERAESQASALAETAQAMSALTENVNANRARVSEVLKTAETAGRQADEGREVVQSAVAAVSRMEASTAKVKDFTGLIDEIAFQTNLLALNAAVEAARAGEAGKGFAVVAAEVRSLAQRASDASREIGEVIAQSAEHAEQGVSLVTRTGETLGALLDAVKRVSSMMGEVDRAIGDQTAGIGEMDAAIRDVDGITQQNAELALHAARAAERLSEQAEGLTHEASRFRTAAPAKTATAARAA